MEIQTRCIGKILIMELTGRLDAQQGPRVIEQLNRAAPTTNSTIMNLSKVQFIDSTGLAVLVKGMRQNREKAGDLVLCELQQPVRIIFELTHLDRAFHIYPTEQAALQSLN